MEEEEEAEMVPLAATSEEREQPLVLVSRTQGLGEEVGALHRKVVKLTRKRGAGQSGGQIKGHTLAARGGKGHLNKAGLTDEPVQPRKPSSSETSGPMSSSVLLQERGKMCCVHVGREGGGGCAGDASLLFSPSAPLQNNKVF